MHACPRSQTRRAPANLHLDGERSVGNCSALDCITVLTPSMQLAYELTRSRHSPPCLECRKRVNSCARRVVGVSRVSKSLRPREECCWPPPRWWCSRCSSSGSRAATLVADAGMMAAVSRDPSGPRKHRGEPAFYDFRFVRQLRRKPAVWCPSVVDRTSV